jgi:hypothetical protein
MKKSARHGCRTLDTLSIDQDKEALRPDARRKAGCGRTSDEDSAESFSEIVD